MFLIGSYCFKAVAPKRQNPTAAFFFFGKTYRICSISSLRRMKDIESNKLVKLIKERNKEMERMKVVKLLATQSGVSQQTGNPWKSRDVILEAVQNAVHPDRYVARLFGDAVDKFTAKEGEVLGVALYHKVEEYNGRYFGKTSIVDFEGIK